MAYSNQFGGVTIAQTPWLDTNFNQAGLLGTIPCTVSGTNTLVLTPYTAPTIGTPPFALQAGVRVQGIAGATNTGAVTAAVGGTAALAVYKDTASGPAALTGNEIVARNSFVLTYDAALNSGVGGYHLGSATSSSAGTVTDVATGTGLSGGPITSAGTITLASISNSNLLGNISGSSGIPSGHTLPAILDSIISSSQGAILNRGASTWGASTEQSWTPALALGGGSVSLTYGTQAGSYFTVGYLVVASFALTLTAKGSSSGNATISLPVNSGGSNRIGAGFVANYSNLTSITTVPWLYIPPSSATASILTAGSATVSNATDANIANNSVIDGIMFYFSG
jgi:hypothetical protein